MANGNIQLAKLEASNRIAAAKRRGEKSTLERTLVHKGVLISTSAAYGAMNRMKVPVSIAGFPWKLGIGALALLGEGLTGGNLQAVFSGISDSTMAIYIERSITTDTIIAGEDDPETEGGEV